jgi:histidinol phosphatase-like PHP family hydrolase
MDQDNEQALKPIRIERLIQSIDEIGRRINKLLAKKEILESELENAQKNEILAIINSQYKTPEEIAAFIKQAKNGGFMLELVKQEGSDKTNEPLEDDTD